MHEDASAATSSRHAPADVVLVNGLPHPWRVALTVAELLQERVVDGHAVATAVNGRFVARPARAQTMLAPGDTLLVFAAIVGG